MTGHDDEFEDFLRRKRPMFGRPDDSLEPPAELDRVVLRHAREAIEADRPQRMFRAPGWGMPVALAATLVLAFTVILRVESPPKAEPRGEVTVQTVSRQVEMANAAAPAAAPAPPPPAAAPVAEPMMAAQSAANEAVVVDIDAAPSSAAQPAARRLDKVADAARAAPPSFASDEEAARYAQPMAGPTVAAAAPAMPAYRRDAKTWLAEIERLRTDGDVLRADAELAEYKRQHRAYAGAPDR